MLGARRIDGARIVLGLSQSIDRVNLDDEKDWKMM